MIQDIIRQMFLISHLFTLMKYVVNMIFIGIKIDLATLNLPINDNKVLTSPLQLCFYIANGL